MKSKPVPPKPRYLYENLTGTKKEYDLWMKLKGWIKWKIK